MIYRVEAAGCVEAASKEQAIEEAARELYFCEDTVVDVSLANERSLRTICRELIKLVDEGALIDLADVKHTPISQELRRALKYREYDRRGNLL